MKKKEELPACPVATTVQLIGSKWKLLILRNLLARPWRFNELQKSLEGISQKCLRIVCGQWKQTELLPVQSIQKYRQARRICAFGTWGKYASYHCFCEKWGNGYKEKFIAD